MLVDEVGSRPQLVHVDAGSEPEPGERLCGCLRRHAMHRQRDRIDRGGDHVGTRPRGFDRRGQRVAGGALGVEPDRQARHFAQLRHELARAMRLQQRRGVVEKKSRCTELRQATSSVDERLVPAAAVEQAGFELAAGLDDRLRRLAQILDVVQRIVQPEDVDPARRGARDESSGEVVADGPRTDEEATAQCQSERRRRPRLQCAQALPRALDATADRTVEDAAARDLEIGEARPVEQLGETQELGGRHAPGERVLAEDPDRRIDKAWHGRGPYRRRGERFTSGRSRPRCPWPGRLYAFENKPELPLPKEVRSSRTHTVSSRCASPSPTRG